MQMIADILLGAGALGAAVYCVVLAGRLKRFNNLQSGMGGAVAVLSAQVDDMTRTLQQAQKAAVTSSVNLTGLTERAEEVAKRLELVLASMHDLPDTPGEAQSARPSEPAAGAAPPAPPPAPPEATAPKVDAPQPDPEGTPFFLSNRLRAMEAAE